MGHQRSFLVGFFLQVGLAGFPSLSGLRMVLIFLALLPVKAVHFFVLFVAFRLRARTAFMSSTALTAYSEFALITLVAASQTGLVQPGVAVMIALLVALSYALNAPLNHVANAFWARSEEQFARLEFDVQHPDQQPHTIGKPNFLVVGVGRAGTAAFDRLIEADERPLGIDSDPIEIAGRLEAGRRVIFGRGVADRGGRNFCGPADYPGRARIGRREHTEAQRTWDAGPEGCCRQTQPERREKPIKTGREVLTDRWSYL